MCARSVVLVEGNGRACVLAYFKTRTSGVYSSLYTPLYLYLYIAYLPIGLIIITLTPRPGVGVCDVCVR